MNKKQRSLLLQILDKVDLFLVKGAPIRDLHLIAKELGITTEEVNEMKAYFLKP